MPPTNTTNTDRHDTGGNLFPVREFLREIYVYILVHIFMFLDFVLGNFFFLLRFFKLSKSNRSAYVNNIGTPYSYSDVLILHFDGLFYFINKYMNVRKNFE